MLTVAIQSREWITIKREKYTRRLHLLLLDFLPMFPWDARRLKNVRQETPPDPTCGTWFGDLVSPPWQWNVYLKKNILCRTRWRHSIQICAVCLYCTLDYVKRRIMRIWTCWYKRLFLMILQYSNIIPLCPWSTLCSNQGLFCEQKSELT